MAVKFGVVERMFAKLKATQLSDVERSILAIIQNDRDVLISFIQDQLQQSIDGAGKALGRYKSKAYARRKGRLTIDLKLLGGFYEGMFIDTDQFPVTIYSTDEKTVSLVNRFGIKIFDLTKKNLDLYVQVRFKAKVTEYYKSFFTR